MKKGLLVALLAATLIGCASKPVNVTTADPAIVTFDFNSAKLDKKDMIALDAFAIKARNVNGTVEVVGHTDFVGTKSFNNDLGMKRAKAVAKYLKAAGVNVINVMGHGELEPQEVGKYEGVDETNRGVTTILHYVR